MLLRTESFFVDSLTWMCSGTVRVYKNQLQGINTPIDNVALDTVLVFYAIAMSAGKVSKDLTKWTLLNLLKDNCYQWTESGSIADVRERYLLLKASLFVGIIDLISPRRSCLQSQSFGASTS